MLPFIFKKKSKERKYSTSSYWNQQLKINDFIKQTNQNSIYEEILIISLLQQ